MLVAFTADKGLAEVYSFKIHIVVGGLWRMSVCVLFFSILSDGELSLTHVQGKEWCIHFLKVLGLFPCLSLLHSCTDFCYGLSIGKKWQIHVC